MKKKKQTVTAKIKAPEAKHELQSENVYRDEPLKKKNQKLPILKGYLQLHELC